jgi:hypothetical protein
MLLQTAPKASVAARLAQQWWSDTLRSEPYERPVTMRMTCRSLLRCVTVLGLLAGCGDEGHQSTGTAAPNLTPWPMHIIDYRYRGANALSPGDVNGDGLVDYVTNYEFDQRYVIELHPPRGADARRPWPTIVAYFLGERGTGTGTDTTSSMSCRST